MILNSPSISDPTSPMSGMGMPMPKAMPNMGSGMLNPGMMASGGFVPDHGFGAAPQSFSSGGAPSNAEMYSRAVHQKMGSIAHSNGLFNSPVPGRTDKLDTVVPAGSYVLPADVVSGLGEGNTMAGSQVLDKMFSTGPYGMQIRAPGRGGPGIPGFPGAPHRTATPKADGGATPTRIIAAGGEYLIHPEIVKAIGGGDIKKGHKILDIFVLHARKKAVKETSKLPPPKK